MEDRNEQENRGREAGNSRSAGEAVNSRNAGEAATRRTDPAQRVAFGAVFAVLALLFSYLETLFPIPLPVPGIKLGLANLVVLLVLYRFGWKDALAVNVVRILLSGLLFGTLFSALYSLCGGLLSFLVMALLKKSGRFSMIGTSIGGGAAHNLGQIAVAAAVVQSGGLFSFLPVLLISGAVTGILTGIAAYLLDRHLPRLSS